MAKIYLKKVPQINEINDCHGCYFEDLIYCKAPLKYIEKLTTICVYKKIIFKQIQKPIKSIKDIPKPGDKK